jgi:hypothetical protein
MYPTTKIESLAKNIGFIQLRRTGQGKISRTTLVDIQDWLRNDYNIHCSVAPWKSELEILRYEANVIDVNNDWRIDTIKSYFKDYYKCLESCITYSLEILEERYGKETKK